MSENRNKIWLEVANVRIGPAAKSDKIEVQVQLKGDKTDREPVWWPVALPGTPKETKADDLYRSIAEGLDKKRMVLASLEPVGSAPAAVKPVGSAAAGVEPVGSAAATLQVKYIRIQFTDSSNR